METFCAKLQQLTSCIDRLEDEFGIWRLSQASREESTASLMGVGSESGRSLDVSLKGERVDVCERNEVSDRWRLEKKE